MSYNEEKIIDYLTLGVGLATSSVLVANYFLNKKQMELTKKHIEAQHELTKLQIEEKKQQINKNNFRNATGIEDITTIIPNQQSNSQDWCSFYAELKRRYGKNTANVIFAKAWDKRKGNGVNTNSVIQCTGQALDRNWFERVEKTAEDVKEGVFSGIRSVFNFGSTTTKIVVWGGIGMIFLLIGTYIYRIATFKPKEWEGLAGKVTEGVSAGAIKALIKK